MKHIAKAILALITSAKLWMTAAALAWLRWDHWSDVSALYGFDSEKDAAKIQAYVTMNHDKNDTGKWIILGFLGITGAVQMSGGSVATNLMRRINQPASEPPPNRSWKSDPNDR